VINYSGEPKLKVVGLTDTICVCQLNNGVCCSVFVYVRVCRASGFAIWTKQLVWNFLSNTLHYLSVCLGARICVCMFS